MQEYTWLGTYRTLVVAGKIIYHYKLSDYNIFNSETGIVVREKNPHPERGRILFEVQNDRANSRLTIKAIHLKITPEAVEEVQRALGLTPVSR